MAAQQPAALDSLGRRNSQIVRRENEKAIRQASAVDVVSSIGFKAKRSGDEILKASLVAQSEELVSYLRSLAGRDCVSDIAVSLTYSHLKTGKMFSSEVAESDAEYQRTSIGFKANRKKGSGGAQEEEFAKPCHLARLGICRSADEAILDGVEKFRVKLGGISKELVAMGHEFDALLQFRSVREGRRRHCYVLLVEGSMQPMIQTYIVGKVRNAEEASSSSTGPSLAYIYGNDAQYLPVTVELATRQGTPGGMEEAYCVSTFELAKMLSAGAPLTTWEALFMNERLTTVSVTTALDVQKSFGLIGSMAAPHKPPPKDVACPWDKIEKAFYKVDPAASSKPGGLPPSGGADTDVSESSDEDERYLKVLMSQETELAKIRERAVDEPDGHDIDAGDIREGVDLEPPVILPEPEPGIEIESPRSSGGESSMRSQRTKRTDFDELEEFLREAGRVLPANYHIYEKDKAYRAFFGRKQIPRGGTMFKKAGRLGSFKHALAAIDLHRAASSTSTASGGASSSTSPFGGATSSSGRS
eukprot:TRINITY_DN22277_c0_g1_i10.p1 TRINITY_DN22277_c0_g1~~TRINITY_DN22277_c0_g1_i10.p1  ORF type:complete len:567 (-),score=100.28 TRINITY_DN22277_c0_g1_i10:91-1680(-)